MLMVANLANTKCRKNLKNDWNPGTWVLILSSHRELPNKPDRFLIVFQNLYVIVLWMKVASALEGWNPGDYDIFKKTS